ncbi:MAG: hypothetical protein DRI57_00955 [Deltaproteobacteria bacterium]|nr:MAG: hypothetical protein DRI57_00955 [Deltaproteobacteria bacterium]
MSQNADKQFPTFESFQESQTRPTRFLKPRRSVRLLNLCDRKIRHARLKIDTGYWYADRDKTC